MSLEHYSDICPIVLQVVILICFFSLDSLLLLETKEIRSRALQLKEHWMQMVDNNTNKIPRSETEDTQNDHPRKRTRIDGAQTQYSEEVMNTYCLTLLDTFVHQYPNRLVASSKHCPSLRNTNQVLSKCLLSRCLHHIHFLLLYQRQLPQNRNQRFKRMPISSRSLPALCLVRLLCRHLPVLGQRCPLAHLSWTD